MPRKLSLSLSIEESNAPVVKKARGRSKKLSKVILETVPTVPTDVSYENTDVSEIGDTYISSNILANPSTNGDESDIQCQTNDNHSLNSRMDVPIVLKLAISPSKLDELIYGEDMNSILTYNPTLSEPEPYFPSNNFMSANDNLEVSTLELSVHQNSTNNQVGRQKQNSILQTQSVLPPVAKNMSHTPDGNTTMNNTNNTKTTHHRDTKCYWCCHNIIDTAYGMPVRYDVFHNSFAVFGSFCSLECAAAYNYSIHMGSNKVWEIHSWIQLLGKKYGLNTPIRPAPSRYLLSMFNGPLEINEFRNAHKGLAQTYVMNIPPFVHINSQMELINTSVLDKERDNHKQPQSHTKDTDNVDGIENTKEVVGIKSYIKTDRTSTLEQKMNLMFDPIPNL